MRHDPLLLGERVSKLLNRQTVIIYHVLVSAGIMIDATVDRSYYGNLVYAGIMLACTVFMAFGLIRYFNFGGVNNHPAAYLIFYHILFTASFGLLGPEYSPWLFIWLILLYVANYFYGARGYLLSIGSLILTLLMQMFRLIPPGSAIFDFMQFVVVQLVVIVAISSFFVQSEEVSDKDRKLLVTSIDKAQLERQRLISLINSMADGVITTDDNGTIKLYNAAALNILDTNQSLQDRNIRDCMNLIDQSAKTVDPIEEAEKKNINVTTTDLMLVYPDGEKINVYCSVSPIKLGFRHDSERGYIVAFRDITREKSLEEERNEFISVVSHELRTPIAITEANISNAQFIVDKGDNLPAIKTSLEAAHKQALFLANMINDLSTLSRAERGKLDMKTEEIDPLEILKSLEDDYQKDAATKKLEFSTSTSGDIPKTIISNRLYVREILQNFVTNSIKYTKEGSVKVVLAAKDGGVEFMVKDTGIGISKSDQKRVFDKFFRSEDFRTRESSGTGLGLYVTKKLMKLIGAEIDLKSRLNEGSTFIVYIPDLTDKKIG